MRTTVILRFALDEPFLTTLRATFPAVDFPICATPEELAAAIGGADAIIGGGPLAADLLATAPRLRWVQLPVAGVDGMDTGPLVAHGLTVTTFSGVTAPNIAEHIVMLMFAFARNLRLLLRQQDRHIWRDGATAGDPRQRAASRTLFPPVFELEGQTLGVVGLGAIGDALARKAHGVGMRVIATRRRPGTSPPHIARLFAPDALPALLAEADHVALCLPLTPETRGLIGAAELARMRPTAYLYNTGRGALVDQDALIDALRAGTIAGAELDVTTPEPLPADSPLWDLPNVLMTAHTSGATPRHWERGLALISENVRRFLADEPLQNRFDPAAGY
jgi:phosphoglycerate dehydrogenase-like enzyme